MRKLNIAYKPHVFLAKKSKGKKESRKFHLSVAIPVNSAAITEVIHEQYDSERHPESFKNSDIYVVCIDLIDIKSPSMGKVDPTPPLQFIGYVTTIKKNKDCKSVAVLVKLSNDHENGHGNQAIHLYDDASGPTGN